MDSNSKIDVFLKNKSIERSEDSYIGLANFCFFFPGKRLKMGSPKRLEKAGADASPAEKFAEKTEKNVAGAIPNILQNP